MTPLYKGLRMAALIPGSRFVTSERGIHALIKNTSAIDKFILELTNFVGGLS